MSNKSRFLQDRVEKYLSPARKHGESQKQYRSRPKQMKLYNKAMRNGNRLLMLPA